MINFDMNMQTRILTLRPGEALSQADFLKVAELVDPVIEKHGSLAGVIIQAESFPGWDSFAGMIGHSRFIRDHHRSVSKVAMVSDATLLTILPSVAAHFISAEVKHFHAGEYDAAVNWIKEEGA